MAEQELTILSTPTHLEGITRLCFSADGNVIFTGGQDCLVRIHQVANPNSEPGFHDQHEEAVTSLTCSVRNGLAASAWADLVQGYDARHGMYR